MSIAQSEPVSVWEMDHRLSRKHQGEFQVKIFNLRKTLHSVWLRHQNCGIPKTLINGNCLQKCRLNLDILQFNMSALNIYSANRVN